MIITNFNYPKHLLLTDNSDKGIAVISCNSIYHDITSKVEQAIREDLDAESVTILSDVEIDYNDAEFLISVKLDKDTVSYDATYYLTLIAIY
jgi:hypothetical protein